MSNDPIEKAKQYLADEDFDKARTVLMMSDHPEREDWLQRVDNVERRQKVESIPKPLNPGWLALLTVFTPIVSVPLLAWNWRRFSKNSWILGTLLGFLLLIVSAGAAIIGAYTLDQSYPSTAQYRVILIYFTTAMSLMLILLYPFLISGRQDKAFKIMKQKNIIAAYDHHYDWGRGLLVWVLSALIIATGFTWFRSQDNHVYDNGSIHLDVPYQWNINSLDYNCSDFYEGCQFVLNRRLDGLHISFHEGGWMNDYEDNQAAADSMWDWSHEGDGFTPLDRETITIGERTGYLIRYVYNDWYWTDIYLHEGNSHLRILIEGYTQEVIDSNWDDMLALMNELEWTPNNQ